MKFYWFNKSCCVPECFNSSTEGEGCFKEYFDLPAEPQARARWLNAILTEDGENLKICEDHFRDEDVFRDKNNRKKLRLNSIPSVKLPKYICTDCYGSKTRLLDSVELQIKPCQCGQPSTALQAVQNAPFISKRTRIFWTAKEKRALFRAIKNYGDIKMGNNNFRINWMNVLNDCRSNGCFGNEKELKSVWQNMRVNATRVYRNEIFGSKLDRKISRFLYGKPLKRSSDQKTSAGCSSANGSKNMDMESTEDEEEQSRPETKYLQDANDDGMKIEQPGEGENGEMEEEEESDEHYSLSDIEQIFQIKIRPKPPEPPTEVISLLSSDEEE